MVVSIGVVNPEVVLDITVMVVAAVDIVEPETVIVAFPGRRFRSIMQ